MLKILFHNDFMEPIRTGEKIGTVRQDRRAYPLGEALAVSAVNEDLVVKINIVAITYKLFRNLDFNDARIGGYDNVGELRQTLSMIYPDLKDNSEVTVVKFEKARL